ncbi:MAG: 5-(carboxyamino)imidazole ribonucleotide synthase [Vicinamibacterales bacterium]
MTEPIPPGSVVGVLGSGQLGRMFAIAARRLGYRVHVFSPDDDTPAGQVADVEIAGSYDDLDAVRGFARRVQAVTFEFENVPAETAAAAAQFAPVRPGGHVLHVAQNRIREKRFLVGAGVPVVPFGIVETADDLEPTLAKIGMPAVIKTADFGYDGKGQAVVRDLADAEAVWRRFGRACVCEAFVEFDREVSVVAARGVAGEFAHFGVVENRHVNHILDTTIATAPVPDTVVREAVDITRTIFEALDVVGVLCVEFFLTRDGRLLVNELAPRPHNSGHFTVDACMTSQFEQQLRAVCGLPLGSPRQLAPAVMVNLLGDIWAHGSPMWARALALPGVKLHLYGKREPRPGRKMGHLTALAESTDTALSLAVIARQSLEPRLFVPPHTDSLRSPSVKTATHL